MTTSALGGALHISMLSEEVVGGSQGKMRRDGVVGGGMRDRGMIVVFACCNNNKAFVI